MLTRFRLVILTALVATTVPAWAGFVRGTVRFADGRPADHIIVRLRSERIDFDTQVQTDIQGKIDFDGVPMNVYHLIVDCQGFRRLEEVVDISMSKMAYANITLQPDKDKSSAVPPEGPGGSLSADAVPAAARKEYDEGQKALNDKKDAEGGIKHFRKAIQLYGKYSEAYLALGLLYMDLGKFDDAQSALQAANEIT